MKKIFNSLLIVLSLFIISCAKKTDKNRAIELVESKYENSSQKLDFENAQLDSAYNISPQAYLDSLQKGNNLDTLMAKLESDIEHMAQEESDSVGEISAKLTKERYNLLDMAKVKPKFIGWTLSKVKIKGESAEELSFKFDKAISKIVE